MSCYGVYLYIPQSASTYCNGCFYIFDSLNTTLNFTLDYVVQRFRGQLKEFFANEARRLAHQWDFINVSGDFSLLLPIPSFGSIERVPLDLPRKKPLVYLCLFKY